MRLVRSTAAYRRAYKRLSVSGKFPKNDLEMVISLLQQDRVLDHRYKDHRLSGNLGQYRECHIKADLLLMYAIEDENLVLLLVNLGSHSDLFS